MQKIRMSISRYCLLGVMFFGITGGVTDAGEAKGGVVINDDGYIVIGLYDNITEQNLRNYLKSYCTEGVSSIAYCVGDMTWPAFYPTKIGDRHNDKDTTGSLREYRYTKNLSNFDAEKGGYFGAVFRIIQSLGKKAIASFRMNDAHLDWPTSLWKKHPEWRLGRDSGYGRLSQTFNYAIPEVRAHFKAMVKEFIEFYPEIDGVELDAMRNPFFFQPDEGAKNAHLMTELMRDIRKMLDDQAKRLNRRRYLLTVNVPVTPEVALECGLDVVAWDAEKLFDYICTGPQRSYMDHPIEKWKKVLKNGTPVYPYTNCTPATGQYLGLEEYRAFAANAYACGADGIYLFNYPCLFELATQAAYPAGKAPTFELPDLTSMRQLDLTKVRKALDEMADPKLLENKNKRFLFSSVSDIREDVLSNRHFMLDIASVDRSSSEMLKAVFRCFENYSLAKKIVLKFKVENVLGTERFEVAFNGETISRDSQQIMYVSNGRDRRVHTAKLSPYFIHTLSLRPEQMRKGKNVLEVKPVKLEPELKGKIYLLEIELVIEY